MVAFFVFCFFGVLFFGLTGIFESLPEGVADKILNFFPD